MKCLSNQNVIHVKKNGVEFLQFRKLLEYSDKINHAYSLGIDRNYRIDNISHTVTEEQKRKSINDYRDLTNAIGCDYTNIVKPHQNHTKEVKDIKKDELSCYAKRLEYTDGLITDEANLVLATTNADCILMLFFDPINNVIANIHSGWKGTIQRISVETVHKMQKKYGSIAENIICCMCPSIHKCHFEVEKDVKNQFEMEFKEVNGFIDETIKGKKWNIDTVLINREILKNEGLIEENIIDSGICSVCNSDQIHSYRAEGKNYGLSTAIIEIKG